jgi:hypothetical protein
LFRETAHFDLIGRHAVALALIETRRDPIYAEHRLVKGIRTRTKKGKKPADTEWERRNVARVLNEQLSRYYELEDGRALWTAPALLRKGRHKIDRSTSWRFAHLCSFAVLEELSTLPIPPIDLPQDLTDDDLGEVED